MEEYAAVILAAGKGTRMEDPSIPKVMHEINGKPIIFHSVNLIHKAGISTIVVVVGYKKEAVIDYWGDNVKYAVQDEQNGTGHATMMARNTLMDEAKAVIVFYGDSPLYKPETIKKLMSQFEKEQPTVGMLTVVSAENADLTGYGRIIRDKDGEVLGIREDKDCTDEERKIREWNPGFYIFDGAWLWNNIDMLQANNAQKEFYLTDMIQLAKDQGRRVIAIPVSDPTEALGINTPEQLKEAEAILKARRQ